MSYTQAELRLIQKDVTIGKTIKQNGSIRIKSNEKYFSALCRTIIGQQISVKAARSIFDRFATETKLVPMSVLKLDEQSRQRIGLSPQKLRYLQDLATHVVNNPSKFEALATQDDETAVNELTQIRGIGVWSAQMFLIFTLARPDVFAPQDRGIQLAMKALYELTDETDTKLLHTIADNWRPYRSTACLHLWRSLDNE